MKVSLVSYQSVSLLNGGPRVQVVQTKRELEHLGVIVELFDPWKPYDRKKNDLYHIFAANLGTFHLASVLNNFSIPFVASSIFFTQHPPAYIRGILGLSRALKKIKSGVWTNYDYTQQICSWSKAVLPNTHDEAALLRDGMGISEKKISVVPNGVERRFEFGDPSLFKKKYGVDKFILNVGHIGPARKNVLHLINALKKIDHPAVIIGKVSDTPEGRQCVEEARRSKNIIIIEGLENDSEMLASAYAACDVFALPSLFETPGIAALEAALAGAKIVITPYGGTKEYFGSMAAYSEPTSVESIKRSIVDSLNAPKTSALKEHVKKEFLWSVVAEKTLAVYKSVLQ